MATNVQKTVPLRPVAPPMDEAERKTRVELAACYRLIAKYGMDDIIYTHISARVPGRHDHFLINPYGLMFHEVTASNLVKIDLDGNIVAPSEYRVNSAGFVIHSAIHMGREDLVCVLHTHTEAGMAVSALKSGLLPVCQTSAEFYNRVAYHDYEGLATDLDERARLVRDLGDKKLMILRNHGLLTCGATAAEAFYYMYYLDKACRVQVKAMMTGELRLPPPEVAEHTARQSEVNQPKGEAVWRALTRQLDREDPSYRN